MVLLWFSMFFSMSGPTVSGVYPNAVWVILLRLKNG